MTVRILSHLPWENILEFSLIPIQNIFFSYSLEMQLVHWKTSYANYAAAAAQTDGLAVLSILFDADNSNQDYEALEVCSFFLPLFVCLFFCLFVCLFVCFFVSFFLSFFLTHVSLSLNRTNSKIQTFSNKFVDLRTEPKRLAASANPTPCFLVTSTWASSSRPSTEDDTSPTQAAWPHHPAPSLSSGPSSQGSSPSTLIK